MSSARQLYAAAALPALLSNQRIMQGIINATKMHDTLKVQDIVAATCFLYADALINYEKEEQRNAPLPTHD